MRYVVWMRVATIWERCYQPRSIRQKSHPLSQIWHSPPPPFPTLSPRYGTSHVPPSISLSPRQHLHTSSAARRGSSVMGLGRLHTQRELYVFMDRRGYLLLVS